MKFVGETPDIVFRDPATGFIYVMPGSLIHSVTIEMPIGGMGRIHIEAYYDPSRVVIYTNETFDEIAAKRLEERKKQLPEGGRKLLKG